MDSDDGFVDFVSARWSALFRLAYVLAGSQATAEDLLQISLEKTWVHWARVCRMESPDAYVRKVMVNTLLSSRRRLAWRREHLRGEPIEVSVPSAESGVVEHSLLWPLVCALPERQRAVVVLRFYEDLSEVETAEVMGCAVGTVKSQTHDAMRSLRRGLAVAMNPEVVSET